MGATDNRNIFVRAPQFKINILSFVNQGKLLFSVLFGLLMVYLSTFRKCHSWLSELVLVLTGMKIVCF